MVIKPGPSFEKLLTVAVNFLLGQEFEFKQIVQVGETLILDPSQQEFDAS